MKLTFDHVNCIYDADTNQPVQALADVSCTLEEHSFVGLIGHTGSGKSTLVQHANGLLKPTSGRVLADGEDIWGERYDRRALRARVGLVFQYPEHQLFETDVLSDVCFGPKNLGKSADEAKAAAREALRLVGMGEDTETASPFDLSGGQKRRVAIAGVLAMRPEILILDEPTAGLDPRGREDILSLVRRLYEESTMTIVLVSHSMEDIARYAGRLLVMDAGGIRFDGPPEEVFMHRDELREMGLSAPQTLLFLDELRDAGLNVPKDAAPLTEDAAAALIAEALGRGC